MFQRHWSVPQSFSTESGAAVRPIKTKVGRAGIALSKILLRGLTGYHKLGKLEKHLKDGRNATKPFIDRGDFVFVLDDIDRKSSMLNINSLIGWKIKPLKIKTF